MLFKSLYSVLMISINLVHRVCGAEQHRETAVRWTTSRRPHIINGSSLVGLEDTVLRWQSAMAQILDYVCWGLQNLLIRNIAFASAAILLVALIYRTINTIYLRSFHPLSRFAGPSEAARSSRWIYRVTDGGFPEEELEQLHEKYREYQLALKLLWMTRLTDMQRQKRCALALMSCTFQMYISTRSSTAKASRSPNMGHFMRHSTPHTPSSQKQTQACIRSVVACSILCSHGQGFSSLSLLSTKRLES